MSEAPDTAARPQGTQHHRTASIAAASRKLLRILSDARVLDRDDLVPLLEKHPKEFLGDVLVREGVLVEDYLQGLLIRTLQIPYVAADCCTVHPEVAALLTEEFCREHHVMPLSQTREFLTLAVANPLDQSALTDVRNTTGLEVRVVLAAAGPLDALIEATHRKPPEPEETLPEELPAEEPQDESDMSRYFKGLTLEPEQARTEGRPDGDAGLEGDTADPALSTVTAQGLIDLIQETTRGLEQVTHLVNGSPQPPDPPDGSPPAAAGEPAADETEGP